MAIEFEWEEPREIKATGGPNAGTTPRQRELDAFADMLRKNPGRYAHLGQRPTSGGLASFRRRGLEIATRKRPDGQYDVYVRAPWH